MSFSTILSAAIDGLGVELVRVEADVSNGLPVFHMVGYLSSEVKEAGERVRTAIRNSGFDYPASVQSSTCRRLRCGKGAHPLTCPSRWRSWRLWGRSAQRRQRDA